MVSNQAKLRSMKRSQLIFCGVKDYLSPGGVDLALYSGVLDIRRMPYHEAVLG